MKIYDVWAHRSYEVDPIDIQITATKARSGFMVIGDDQDDWHGNAVVIRKSAYCKYPKLKGMDYILFTTLEGWRKVVKEISRPRK